MPVNHWNIYVASNYSGLINELGAGLPVLMLRRLLLE